MRGGKLEVGDPLVPPLRPFELGDADEGVVLAALDAVGVDLHHPAHGTRRARLPVGMERHASHGVGFLLGQLVEHAQDGRLGADRLAAAGGRADECVVVGVVHALEHLGLHRVEVLDPGRVETVKSILLQRRRRQGLQVEQLRGRRVLVRKEQVLEADWDDRLRPEPAVGHHAHEVLGRQGVEQGDGEGNRVVLLGVDLLEQKEFVVKDHLAIVVLDDDPEALHVPVHLLVPLKVRGEGQVHLEH